MLYQDTVLEINLKHLEHNYHYLRSKLKDNVKLLAVIKAFGYGTDASLIAQFLQKIGIDYLAVAYAQEGKLLRKSGIMKPILALHPQQARYEDLIEYNITPCLYSFKSLNEFLEVSTAYNHTINIHIKFNTGINRIGFQIKDVAKIYKIMQQYPNVKVEGILSHFAASEDLNETEFTQNQITDFKSIQKSFETHFNYNPIYHICNTSGILNYPQAHFNMVRSGIGLFGYGNDRKHNTYLKPVAALRSVISQINTLEIGDSLGYNRAFRATRKTLTATVPIGYADGISRAYGQGKGYVMLHRQKASIIGNICMDMLMLDVTDIECKEGDVVTFYDSNYPATQLTQKAHTISYELLTAIAARVKRVIIS